MSEYFTSEQMRDLLTDTKDAVEALEEKVDKMLDGTNPANVQLTGSNMDDRGLFEDRPVSPTKKGTTYWAIDKMDTDDELTIWNGTDWEAI